MLFTEWKQKALEEILKDDELTKLLKYNSKDWKFQPSLTEEERYDLVNEKIFKYRYADVIPEVKSSFVSMGLNYFAPQEGWRQFSNKYVMGYLYFYILVERSIRDTPVGDRADLIVGRIYDILEESRFIGIGELKMKTQGELWIDNSTYSGYQIGFQVIEFK